MIDQCDELRDVAPRPLGVRHRLAVRQVAIGDHAIDVGVGESEPLDRAQHAIDRCDRIVLRQHDDAALYLCVRRRACAR